MESTAAPVLVISAAIISSYWVGQTAGLTDVATGLPTGGLFGTAVATMAGPRSLPLSNPVWKVVCAVASATSATSA